MKDLDKIPDADKLRVFSALVRTLRTYADENNWHGNRAYGSRLTMREMNADPHGFLLAQRTLRLNGLD